MMARIQISAFRHGAERTKSGAINNAASKVGKRKSWITSASLRG